MPGKPSRLVLNSHLDAPTHARGFPGSAQARSSPWAQLSSPEPWANPTGTLNLISKEECGPGHTIQHPNWRQATWGITTEPRNGVIPEVSGGPGIRSPSQDQMSCLLPTMGIRSGGVGRASSQQTWQQMRWECS